MILRLRTPNAERAPNPRIEMRASCDGLPRFASVTPGMNASTCSTCVRVIPGTVESGRVLVIAYGKSSGERRASRVTTTVGSLVAFESVCCARMFSAAAATINAAAVPYSAHFRAMARRELNRRRKNALRRRPSTPLGIGYGTSSQSRRRGRRDLIPTLREIRNAMHHPIRRRRSLQLVVEELLHAVRDVLLIRAALRIVDVTVVADEVHLLAESPHADEQLDALIPRYGVVHVILHHEQWRRDLVEPEERGILDETCRILPDRSADAALRRLVLEGARESSAPTDAAVRARHVHDRRAEHRRREDVRLRDHVEALVSAPRLTLHTELRGIDVSAREQHLDAGDDRLHRARTRIALFIMNAGLEDDVAVRRVVRRVDHVTTVRRHVRVTILRE